MTATLESMGMTMGKVTVAPESLGNPQHQAQVVREDPVQQAGPEERPVDEVMGDGIGVPPEPQCDQGCRRKDAQQEPMDGSQGDEQCIPRRTSQDASWSSDHGCHDLWDFTAKWALATGTSRELPFLRVRTRQV